MKLPYSQDTFLLGQLLRVNNHHNGWKEFIEALRVHFNLHACHLNIFNQHDFSFIFTVGAGWFPSDEMLTKYLNEYIELDPIVLAISSKEIGQMYATNFLSEETEIYDTYFWKTWAFAQGFTEGAGACISESDNKSTTFITSRTAQQGKYSREELDRLNCLLPFIEEALRTSTSLSQQQSSSIRLQAVINQYRMPVAVLTEYAEVTVINDMMSSYLGAQKQLKLENKSLRFEEIKQNKLLNLSLFDITQKAAGININIEGLRKIKINEKETLFLEQLIEEIGGQDIIVGTLVYIVSQHYLGNIKNSTLRDLFSLTKTETEICEYILNSRKPKEIAQLTSKSIHTVREQINSIYLKTGCNSQISLVNLIASIPSIESGAHRNNKEKLTKK